MSGPSRRLRRASDPLERAAGRYLAVVMGALLNEHYLENELRVSYLLDCIEKGKQEVDPLELRDPERWLKADLKRLRDRRQAGDSVASLAGRAGYPFTAAGRIALEHLQRCLELARHDRIEGDLAACGVWRGGVAVFMRAFLEAYEIGGPRVWVADSFGAGAEPRDSEAADMDPLLVADLNVVREGFDRFGLLDSRVRFLQGSFEDTLAEAPVERLAAIYIGAESGNATSTVLDDLYGRLTPGGFVIVDHYDRPGCREAVERFRGRRSIDSPLERVGARGASWRKREPTGGRAATLAPPAIAPELHHPPLAPPQPEDGKDLSVVIVVHDMRREAPRTLHSLSRSYQRGIEDLDYEVIVVENGSSPTQKLGPELVRSFGSEFRYLDLDADAKPSPAHALNRGIGAARGETLAMMIDGAHVLTPGVLRLGMLALRTHPPAVATVHQFYLGPGQQGETMRHGYDRDYEDRLFEEIEWPADGHRLFEIGHFIAGRDWFDALWETNCLFAPRALLEQYGGYDESFAMPGGGYANLDIFERLAAAPGVTVVDLLGEGSFHQLHGGTTTNQPDLAERHARLMSYRQHYESIRHRPYKGPGKQRHFVGSLPDAARRTRPRWMTARAFKQAQRVRADGFPKHPAPIPEDLLAEYTEAYWRGLTWRETTWLGRRAHRSPGDLLAYQSLVYDVRPDWILETRAGNGGRALFFASVCELLGSGQVLSIRPNANAELPQHPRLTYVIGAPNRSDTREKVFAALPDGAKVLLVVAAGRRNMVLDAFDAYSRLVPVGSYAVIEDTILNGHPVLPEHGPGPAEAVEQILKRRDDFAVDRTVERFGVSFSPGGFLKRIA